MNVEIGHQGTGQGEIGSDGEGSRPRLMIVIASTRPGRVGLPVGEWFTERARADGRFEIDFADLAEVNLPLMDEPRHPRFRQYEHAHTIAWSDRVDAADAFVFVTPEYNHGFNPALKNAIDYLNQEWRYKPVGFVCYGGVSAGTRAREMLQQVVTAVRMVPVVECVSIPFIAQFLDEERRVQANEIMEQAAADMLGELERVAMALRPLRMRVD